MEIYVGMTPTGETLYYTDSWKDEFSEILSGILVRYLSGKQEFYEHGYYTLSVKGFKNVKTN